MMRISWPLHVICFVIALASWTWAAIAQDETPVPAVEGVEQAEELVPSDNAPDTPRAVRISSDEIQIDAMVINEARQCVQVPGRVNMDGGQVEVLACSDWGKVHESVLVLDVAPHILQVGLLLIGLKYSADPDSADHVSIRVIPEGGDPIEAEELLIDERTQTTLPPRGWWFRGSRLQDGFFAAERWGTLVATYRDPDAVLDNSGDTGTDDTVVAINERRVPPRGTSVLVEFSRTDGRHD